MRYQDEFDENPLIEWIVKNVSQRIADHIASGNEVIEEEILDCWLDDKGDLTTREREAIMNRLLGHGEVILTKEETIVNDEFEEMLSRGNSTVTAVEVIRRTYGDQFTPSFYRYLSI